LTVPLLYIFVLCRSVYHFIARVCICEPLFKAYCTRYGRNLHTGVFWHWVQGRGDLLIGDDVSIDGKCTFVFAARYSPRPALKIGSHTGIGHGASFTVGKSITIGENCRIGPGVHIFDSPGHPADPAARLAGRPAADSEVKPVVIGDNVWIGTGAMILPGVTISRNSVVAVGAVVMNDVPADTVVAGNPARHVRLVRSGAAL
jgi:acetyltransferase-like isoleucine patch superfamily enzyme